LRLWPLGPSRDPNCDGWTVIGVECLVERCAGLDIGKADLKACVRVPGARGGCRAEVPGRLHPHHRDPLVGQPLA